MRVAVYAHSCKCYAIGEYAHNRPMRTVPDVGKQGLRKVKAQCLAICFLRLSGNERLSRLCPSGGKNDAEGLACLRETMREA